MEKITLEDYEFIKIDLPGAEAIFSTAKNNLSFNKSTDSGKKNIKNLKRWFNLKTVGYLNQVHGCQSIVYTGKDEEEADGIITNEYNTAVGVFNADCIPILLYDKKNKVIAAVHSGWKGTLTCILSKTIEKLERNFKSESKDIIVCVGPHIHSCCYEVGEEVMDKFKNSDFYRFKDVFRNRNLDLKKCILYQLQDREIESENIKYLDICTYCNTEYEMHSYRKNKDYGRMFSFIYLK
jgi:hypothetical protein